MSFDPYHQWLGIPPENQPPDFYQLLGIRRFEQNPTVIAHAAERQLLMLKTMQNGPHGALTQQLMNEITAAHIALADPDKKSQYDTALQSQITAQPPSPPGAKAAETTGPPPIDTNPSTTSPAAESTVPAIRQYHNQKRRSRNRRGKPRRTMWIIAATVAVIGVGLASLPWLSGDSQEPPTAKAGRTPKPGRQPSRARVAQDNARQGTDPTATQDVAHNGPTRKPLSDPSEDQTSPLRPEVAHVGTSGSPTATATPETAGGAAHDPSDSGTSSSSAPAADPSVASEPAEVMDSAVGTATAAGETTDPANALSQLPHQINLLDTVTTTGANYVFVGKLASPPQSSWRVRIEDYASPMGQSRFAVGAVSKSQDCLCWTLHRSLTDDSTPTAPATTDGTDAEDILLRIDASPTELSLWITDPADKELINQLSMCSLIIDAGESRHHVQLTVTHRIPPILLAFDKARQTVTLEQLPSVEDIPPERVLLEIVQVDQSADGVWEGTGVRTSYDEESTVPLNDTLRCELNIKLTKSAEQYGISVMPRFLHNDRRQQMVPNAITKEIARAKSQLTRNQRDLAEAQNSLRVLPQEIRRVRGIVPRTPPEVAAKQAQLSRLVGMADSMQSRVRRLSKVLPEQTATIAHMESVLTYANTLSNRVTLLVRVYARGELQDYLLLEAAGS